MDLNENIIRITGTASIPAELETDRDYKLMLDASCESKARKTRHDGTFDYHYQLQLISGEVITDKGETIQIKDKKSWSQKWRKLVIGRGYDYDDFEAYLFSQADELFKNYESQHEGNR
jgi:hypothetical protein